MDKKTFTWDASLDFKSYYFLDKLHHHGIRGIVNEWFSSYLADRTQTTHIDNDHISSKKNSVTGVPQGYILGPLLFLIYMINDIYLCSNKRGLYPFADDTNLLYPDKSPETVINNELKNVFDWLDANKLTINAKKSIFFCLKTKTKNN